MPGTRAGSMQRCSGKIAFQACKCIDLQRSCRNVACNGCDTGQSNSWVLQQAKEGAEHGCKGAARQQCSASWLGLRLILQQMVNTYQNACSRCSQQLGLMQGRRQRQASCTSARPGGICSLHCMSRSMACHIFVAYSSAAACTGKHSCTNRLSSVPAVQRRASKHARAQHCLAMSTRALCAHQQRRAAAAAAAGSAWEGPARLWGSHLNLRTLKKRSGRSSTSAAVVGKRA